MVNELVKALADQQSMPTSLRVIILNDGTRYVHEVGPLSALDIHRYRKANHAPES